MFFLHVGICDLLREESQFLPTMALWVTLERWGSVNQREAKNERYPPIKPQNSSRQEHIERFLPKIVAENEKTTIFEA